MELDTRKVTASDPEQGISDDQKIGCFAIVFKSVLWTDEVADI
jgi:hypothetical protein